MQVAQAEAALAAQLDTAAAERAVKLAEIQITQANYDLAVIGVNNGDLLDANAKVLNAQVALSNAQTGPAAADVEAAELAAQEPDVTQAEVALAQAQLSLDAARQALAQTVLVAPFDGIVSAVLALAGENVGTSPIVTLSDLSWPAPTTRRWHRNWASRSTAARSAAARGLEGGKGQGRP